MKTRRRAALVKKRVCPLSLACPRESGQKEKDTREGNVSIHSPLWTLPFQRPKRGPRPPLWKHPGDALLGGEIKEGNRERLLSLSLQGWGSRGQGTRNPFPRACFLFFSFSLFTSKEKMERDLSLCGHAHRSDAPCRPAATSPGGGSKVGLLKTPAPAV